MIDTFVFCPQKGDVPPKKDPVATLQYLLGPLPKLMVSDSPSAVQRLHFVDPAITVHAP